jgi:hypothetical protein
MVCVFRKSSSSFTAEPHFDITVLSCASFPFAMAKLNTWDMGNHYPPTRLPDMRSCVQALWPAGTRVGWSCRARACTSRQGNRNTPGLRPSYLCLPRIGSGNALLLPLGHPENFVDLLSRMPLAAKFQPTAERCLLPTPVLRSVALGAAWRRQVPCSSSPAR